MSALQPVQLRNSRNNWSIVRPSCLQKPQPLLTPSPLPCPQDLKNVASIGILVLLAYGALLGAVGKGFHPPSGAFFTVLLIWSSAQLGGLLLSCLLPVMPPLLGMLAAGVLLRNVPGDAARGLSDKAASKIRYGCLAVIFLSSGLEQDPSVFKYERFFFFFSARPFAAVSRSRFFDFC